MSPSSAKSTASSHVLLSLPSPTPLHRRLHLFRHPQLTLLHRGLHQKLALLPRPHPLRRLPTRRSLRQIRPKTKSRRSLRFHLLLILPRSPNLFRPMLDQNPLRSRLRFRCHRHNNPSRSHDNRARCSNHSLRFLY